VLRVSNNGNKTDKVAFEHEVLRQLSEQALSFQVPRALPSKAGRPFELLSNGAACCVWHLIPGALAGSGSIEAVGRAVGEVSTALAKVHVGRAAPNPPYCDLFVVHEALAGDPQRFYQAVEQEAGLGGVRQEVGVLVGAVRRLEGRLATLESLGLPKQLIHGDLHYDNILVSGGQVAGVLDFEFLAHDYRAMELAIALSKYIGEDDPLQCCRQFMAGFAQHGRLTPEEQRVVPDLIQLRILSNVVWFVGRAVAGEDSIASLAARAQSYVRRISWLEIHGQEVVDAIAIAMQAQST